MKSGSDDMLRKALDFKMLGRSGRPKMTWRRQVEEQNRKIELDHEVTINIENWRDAVYIIAMDSR